MLKCKNISKRFGGLQALRHITFDLEPDMIMGLIGPNGAGKTTLINVISGFIKPDSGSVIFMNEYIEKKSPYKIAQKGLARTYQHTKVFKEFSVQDNLEIADMGHGEIETFLKRFGLLQSRNRPAGELSLFDQKKLEIALLLSLKPGLMLLDEPTAGFTPAEKDEFKELIVYAKNELRSSLILIEHDVKFTMDLSDEIIVLLEGGILARGTPDDILKNDEVIKNYIGRSAI